MYLVVPRDNPKGLKEMSISQATSALVKHQTKHQRRRTMAVQKPTKKAR